MQLYVMSLPQRCVPSATDFPVFLFLKGKFLLWLVFGVALPVLLILEYLQWIIQPKMRMGPGSGKNC